MLTPMDEEYYQVTPKGRWLIDHLEAGTPGFSTGMSVVQMEAEWMKHCEKISAVEATLLLKRAMR